MWGGINRRKFPRANYPCQITVKKKGLSDTLTAHTENIGIGGICVELSKDLGIFAPLEIELDLQDNQHPVESEGTIVWIVEKKEEKNKSYDTGIEFTNLKRKDADRINAIIEKISSKA